MYVKTSNQQAEIYPYTIEMLKRDNPNTSFPKKISDELLAEYGLYSVDIDPQPDFDSKTQTLTINQLPNLVDERWVVGWSVNDKGQDQMDGEAHAKAAEIRNQRNDLLAKCDWTVLADSPLTEEKRAEWLTYRQALRDISDLEGFPYVGLPNYPDFVEPEGEV